jgi:hypothetical protein
VIRSGCLCGVDRDVVAELVKFVDEAGFDAAGKEVGMVEYVTLGDPEAITTPGRRRTTVSPG